jgi:hypothetical protein
VLSGREDAAKGQKCGGHSGVFRSDVCEWSASGPRSAGSLPKNERQYSAQFAPNLRRPILLCEAAHAYRKIYFILKKGDIRLEAGCAKGTDNQNELRMNYA